MGATAVIAMIRRKEREVVEDFRAAGATSAATAKSLDEVGIQENHIVRRLCKREVLREASPGQIYLDERVWTATRAMRRRMGIVMLLTIALVGLGVLYGVLTFN